jgi:hypothetical protein
VVAKRGKVDAVLPLPLYEHEYARTLSLYILRFRYTIL